jgi:hypothetical protein
MSVDGGPWNVIAAYTGPSYVYTPSSAGNYDFRLVAIVAPYHSGCPNNLQNDSSNIVSVLVFCPTALSADQISVNPTTIIQTQTVTLSVNNPSNVTLPAQWEVSTVGASGPWNVLAPYTGSSYTYAPLARHLLGSAHGSTPRRVLQSGCFLQRSELYGTAPSRHEP